MQGKWKCAGCGYRTGNRRGEGASRTGGSADRSGKEGGETGTVICAKENKLATIEFLLSYVLPLCAFNFAVWDGVVLFLLFFVIFGILNVKHNYFGMNIAFELMRFRLYECTIKNDDDVDVQRIVVSQRNLCNSIGDTVFLKSINNEYKINI